MAQLHYLLLFSHSLSVYLLLIHLTSRWSFRIVVRKNWPKKNVLSADMSSWDLGPTLQPATRGWLVVLASLWWTIMPSIFTYSHWVNHTKVLCCRIVFDCVFVTEMIFSCCYLNYYFFHWFKVKLPCLNWANFSFPLELFVYRCFLGNNPESTHQPASVYTDETSLLQVDTSGDMWQARHAYSILNVELHESILNIQFYELTKCLMGELQITSFYHLKNPETINIQLLISKVFKSSISY